MNVSGMISSARPRTHMDVLASVEGDVRRRVKHPLEGAVVDGVCLPLFNEVDDA